MLAGKDLSLLEALPVALVGFTLVIVELALLAVLVVLLSKAVRLVEGRLSKKESPAPAFADAAELPETESAGEIELCGVDEPTAAVIMAIVSDKSGIPLNRLIFKSIRIKEEEK